MLRYLSHSPVTIRSIRTMATSSSEFLRWATIDPKALGSSAEPYAVQNLVDGKWTTAASTLSIPHPLDRDAHPIFTVPDTQSSEVGPFVASLRKVSKSGLHNPLKNPERYVQYGEISRKVSQWEVPSDCNCTDTR